MQISILLTFVVVLTLRQAPTMSVSSPVLAAMIALYILLATLIAAGNTSVSLRRLKRNFPAAAVSRKHNRLSLLTQAYLVSALGALIWIGLGSAIERAPLVALVPGLSEALLLAPFVAALALVWVLEYPVHLAVRVAIARTGQLEPPFRPIWTLAEFVGYNFRHSFLFIAAPIGLIIILGDILTLYVWPFIVMGLDRLTIAAGWGLLSGEAMDGIRALLMIVLAGGVFLIAPAMIVRIWRTQRLPDGPLRQQLEADLAALKLSCREILIWQSGGVIANAGVIGLLGRLRYVLLSDALLANLPPRQLQAVFAHEAGHMSASHILYAVLLAVAMIILAGVGGVALFDAGLGVWTAQVLALSVVATVWWITFGFVSRLFERQSDVIGAHLAGRDFASPDQGDRITPEGSAIFAQALQKVAQLNGTAANAYNWRHGSIETRVAFILTLGSTGGSKEGVDRQVRKAKRTILTLMAMAVALAVTQAVFF